MSVQRRPNRDRTVRNNYSAKAVQAGKSAAHQKLMSQGFSSHKTRLQEMRSRNNPKRLRDRTKIIEVLDSEI